MVEFRLVITTVRSGQIFFMVFSEVMPESAPRASESCRCSTRSSRRWQPTSTESWATAWPIWTTTRLLPTSPSSSTKEKRISWRWWRTKAAATHPRSKSTSCCLSFIHVVDINLGCRAGTGLSLSPLIQNSMLGAHYGTWTCRPEKPGSNFLASPTRPYTQKLHKNDFLWCRLSEYGSQNQVFTSPSPSPRELWSIKGLQCAAESWAQILVSE